MEEYKNILFRIVINFKSKNTINITMESTLSTLFEDLENSYPDCTLNKDNWVYSDAAPAIECTTETEQFNSVHKLLVPDRKPDKYYLVNEVYEVEYGFLLVNDYAILFKKEL